MPVMITGLSVNEEGEEQEDAEDVLEGTQVLAVRLGIVLSGDGKEEVWVVDEVVMLGVDWVLDVSLILVAAAGIGGMENVSDGGAVAVASVT